MTPLRIEKLQRGHAIENFDCGREALNRFLVRYAYQNQQADASKTYVALADEEVVGYYTLVVGEVAYEGAHERLTKGLARHPVPIMLLARLAISASWQGQRTWKWSAQGRDAANLAGGRHCGSQGLRRTCQG